MSFVTRKIAPMTTAATYDNLPTLIQELKRAAIDASIARLSRKVKAPTPPPYPSARTATFPICL